MKKNKNKNNIIIIKNFYVFIGYSTFKQQKLTQNALTTAAFTTDVPKKTPTKRTVSPYMKIWEMCIFVCNTFIILEK